MFLMLTKFILKHIHKKMNGHQMRENYIEMLNSGKKEKILWIHNKKRK